MNSSETVVLTFTPWADPRHDVRGLNPDSPYGRFAWLPVIGPTAWLTWTTLAAQLRTVALVTWDADELARAHGVGRGTGKHAPVMRTLTRLAQFGLAAEVTPGCWIVRLSAPPVSPTSLRRAPAWVHELHDQLFAR